MPLTMYQLSTGQLVMGEPVEGTPGTIKIEKPVQVVMDIGPGGQGRVGLIDFLPLCDSTEKWILLITSQIVFQAVPGTELCNAYNSQFGSGLIVPPGVSTAGTSQACPPLKLV